MNKGTQNFIGWSGIILSILVALNQAYKWPGYLQYVWALLVLIIGIWALVAGD